MRLVPFESFFFRKTQCETGLLNANPHKVHPKLSVSFLIAQQAAAQRKVEKKNDDHVASRSRIIPFKVVKIEQ